MPASPMPTPPEPLVPELAPAEPAVPSADPGDSATRRWLFFGLGWLFFALGMIGALLPVMPTTPFLILALWAFSRSSRRFHDWLYHHRLFGPRLQAWHRARVIPLGVKLTAWGGMTVSMTAMVLFGVAWPALLAAGAVMAAGAVFIARCPSRAPEAPRRQPAPPIERTNR